MPQVAETRGLGYVNNKDSSVGLELVFKLSAWPLFAMLYTMKGDLGSLVASFTGITTVFDIAEQAVGVAGHLRTLGKAKKDIQSATKKKTTTTSNTKDGADWSKLFKFKDIQEALNKLEEKIHKKLSDYVHKTLGAKAAVELEFTGFFTASYEFKLNLHKKTLELEIDDPDYGLLKYEHPSQVTFGQDYGIDVVIKLDATIKQTQK